MDNPLILKLQNGARLDANDIAVLLGAVGPVRDIGGETDLICEGDAPDTLNLVIEGFACRYKLLPNGKRSIMAFLVPGDFCDLHVAILDRMDHSIATIPPCRIATIPRDKVIEMTRDNPQIARAMWWATLVDEATLREWLVNVGRRPADRKLAHLYCEVCVRLQTVGRASSGSFPFPLTHRDLADTLGVSSVHVNRVVQTLRDEGLVSIQGRTVTIPDFHRLAVFAEFDPAYLHLAERG